MANEGRRARGGRAAASQAESPAEAGAAEAQWKDFELPEAASNRLRAEGADKPALWREFGAEMGFAPESIAISGDPSAGPISFSAVVTDEPVSQLAAELAGDDVAPAAEEEPSVDHEAAHEAALDHMAEAVDDLDLESETLVGDLTDGILEVVKRLQKPWDAHSQHEKRDLVAKIEHIAKNVARQAVDVVAADDRENVRAIVEKISITDKVQITLKLAAMPEEEISHAISALYAQQKKTVLIVTADADRHMGKRREPVQPDQDPLPFEAGSDAPALPAPAAPPGDDSDLAGAAEEEEEAEQQAAEAGAAAE